MASFDLGGATLNTDRIDITKFRQRPNELLLYADLQDKQIVDLDGRKVVRVNDLRLDELEGTLHLVAVDVGRGRPARRLGIEGPYRRSPATCGCRCPERYIDWEDVDPVETSIASIRLRVPHAGLRELHPADLASIIDQLAPRDRAGVLASLDDEAAADAIEEMEPDTQVEVLEDLPAGACRRHPRGDEPRRCRRPHRRPVRDRPRGDPAVDGDGPRPGRWPSCWATPRNRPAA